MTETPAQIAARHGAHCPPGLRITVCPPATFSRDISEAVSWKQAQTNAFAARERVAQLKPRPAPKQTAAEKADADMEARNMRWHALVWGGMPRAEACKTVGLSPESSSRIAQWLRRKGLDLPAQKMGKAPRGLNETDLRWFSLVRAGMGKNAAARECGLKPGSWYRVQSRLEDHGHYLDMQEAAE